jgi:hypothetical protein
MKGSAPERDRRDQGEFDPNGSTVLAAAGSGVAANFFWGTEEQPHAKEFSVSTSAE